MREPMTWEPGTVWDNVDAFVNAIGVEDVGVVWGLANVDWAGIEQRDSFIETVLKAGVRAAGAVTGAFGQNIRAGIDAIPGLPDFPAQIQPAKKYRDDEWNPAGGWGGVEGWPLNSARNDAVA